MAEDYIKIILWSMVILFLTGSVSAECRSAWCVSNSIPTGNCCTVMLANLGYGCSNGEGDCDINAECTGGATCVFDVGLSYGCENYQDICVLDSSASSSSSSSSIVSSSSSSTSSSSTSSSSSEISSSYYSSSSSSSSIGSTSTSQISSSSSSSSSYASTTSSSSYASSSSSSSSAASVPSAASSISSSSSSSSSIPTTTYIAQTIPYSCSREYGFAYNITMIENAAYNTFKINLSNFSQYVLHDLSNVYVGRGEATYSINQSHRSGIFIEGSGGNNQKPIYSANRVADYTMYINATPCIGFQYTWLNGTSENCDQLDNNIFVYVSGWDWLYNWTTMADKAAVVNYNPLATDFSRYGNTYMMSLKNEVTSNDFNITGSNITRMIVDVKCQNYSHYIMDLRWLQDYNKTQFFLATREPPSLMITIDALGQTAIHKREIKMLGGDNVQNFYLIPSPYNRNIYDFSLLDYSLIYESDSYLRIREHISYTYATIFSRSWYADNVFGVDLIPGYAYDVDVCSNSNSICYSLGSLTATANGTMLLTINKPILNEPIYNYNDLTVSFNRMNTSNTFGLTWTSKRGTPIANITLNVFNISSNGNYTLDYTSTLNSQNGTIYYTLPANGSVMAEAVVETTTHGRLIEDRPIQFGKITYDLSAFNMSHSPTTFIGTDKSTWFMFISFILVLTVTLVISKATSIGYGIISGSLAFGMLNVFSWIPSAVPGWIFIIMMIFGIGVKLAESRIEVIG